MKRTGFIKLIVVTALAAAYVQQNGAKASEGATFQEANDKASPSKRDSTSHSGHSSTYIHSASRGGFGGIGTCASS